MNPVQGQSNQYDLQSQLDAYNKADNKTRVGGWGGFTVKAKTVLVLCGKGKDQHIESKELGFFKRFIAFISGKTNGDAIQQILTDNNCNYDLQSKTVRIYNKNNPSTLSPPPVINLPTNTSPPKNGDAIKPTPIYNKEDPNTFPLPPVINLSTNTSPPKNDDAIKPTPIYNKDDPNTFPLPPVIDLSTNTSTPKEN